jgi:hypothetical protein
MEDDMLVPAEFSQNFLSIFEINISQMECREYFCLS